MNPLSLLSSGGGMSLKGGDAGPSEATAASGSGSYSSMNNPFSVAGQGGKANSTAEMTSPTNMIMIALTAAVLLVVLFK